MITSVNVKSMSVDEAKQYLKSLGEPAYRGEQVLEWLYRTRLSSYEMMTNLPLRLRELLEEEAPLRPAQVLAKQTSSGGTRKYLIGLADGNAVETVLIPHDYGLSICVSSQVGCAMGCAFCASGLDGVVRSLECGEMVDQMLAVSDDVAASEAQVRKAGLEPRVSSVVMMGSGEPLANYDNVLKFIRLINWERGFAIGYRHITVSTCGIIPGIERLSSEGIPVTLSVSLHAPDDDTRSKIMKVNEAYPVNDLVRTCVSYAAATGRRVTYEYALIDGINDSQAHADRLARLLRGTLCHVNLIPLNPVKETGFGRPSPAAVERFAQVLIDAGVDTTLRREMGTDIDAACGQLRHRWVSGAGGSGDRRGRR